MTSIIICLGVVFLLALIILGASRIEKERDRRLLASLKRHKARMEALDELKRQLEHIAARRQENVN